MKCCAHPVKASRESSLKSRRYLKAILSAPIGCATACTHQALAFRGAIDLLPEAFARDRRSASRTGLRDEFRDETLEGSAVLEVVGTQLRYLTGGHLRHLQGDSAGAGRNGQAPPFTLNCWRAPRNGETTSQMPRCLASQLSRAFALETSHLAMHHK
jgi:hypothetical protein